MWGMCERVGMCGCVCGRGWGYVGGEIKDISAYRKCPATPRQVCMIGTGENKIVFQKFCPDRLRSGVKSGLVGLMEEVRVTHLVKHPLLDRALSGRGALKVSRRCKTAA